MTERLYYTSPHTVEFDATVVAIERVGERSLVRLDRTAFYPTSGGQPHDTGSLGGARVVEVSDDEAGDVVHVLEGADPAVGIGGAVHGIIDWERRFDHMQQHSGQHVLSAAFDRLFGARTVGFHLGAESATIDLGHELRPEDIVKAEEQANGVVWEDRPIAIQFVTLEEAARLPLRKEPAREGTLRLIDIQHFDLSACGGTHVSSTGAIGVIAILSSERFKSGLRVEFACGERVLRHLRALRDAVAGSVRLLSVLPADLPAAIERLQQESKDQRRAAAMLQNELSRYRGAELAAEAEDTARGRLLVRSIDGDAATLKALASAVTARPGYLTVLVSTATPLLAVVARSPDGDLRANDVLAGLTAKFGGRGGGKADLAQGGGLNGAPDAVLAEARRLIDRQRGN